MIASEGAPYPEAYDPTERDYTCVASRDFAPLLRKALLWAAQRSDLDGLQEQQPIAGATFLAEQSGVDAKTIIRIAKFHVLLVELRTVDAILTAAELQHELRDDLVIPKSRAAARRMAEAELLDRDAPKAAIEWRADELWQRHLAAVSNPPTPLAQAAERNRERMRRSRLTKRLGRYPTDVEDATEADDAEGAEEQ